MTVARAGVRWPRVSIRTSVAFVVAVVTVAPLLLVVVWLRVERRFESRMKNNVTFSAHEALGSLTLRVPPTSYSAPTPLENALETVARAHRVRVRLLDVEGHVLEDYDFDRGRDLSEQAGEVVLKRGGDPETRAFDTSLGPIDAREEFRRALSEGRAEGCRDVSDLGLIVCHALRRQGQQVIYVQDTSERPLATLYELRFQLGRLTLVVVPFAVLLAWWAGRRVVNPLEALHDQVLAKVRESRPKADLVAPAINETADLATAFNTLLGRLAERRAQNEAFVADLVHEFKNPLATLRACADTLADGSTDAERIQRIARLLRDSSTRLDAMVSEFLELARAEAGMLKEAWETVDLAALARGTVQAMRDDERWSKLELFVSADEVCLVRGVATRLEAVLRNLLVNAGSFSGERGKVHVTVKSEGDSVVLAVSDTGPGIAEHDRPHVFERFFTTRRHDKGTGLGLALVQAVVEAHGGEVSVHSEPGIGATFRAKLPKIRGSL